MKIQVFIPLYNITIPDKYINRDIAGFKFITNKIIEAEYEQDIIKFSPYSGFIGNMKADILEPRAGMLYERALSKFILFKEYDAKYKCDATGLSKEFEQDCRNIQVEIETFLLAMRFADKGRLQVNKGYMFAKLYQNEFNFHSSTPIENISSWYRTVGTHLYEYDYAISEDNLKSILHIFDNLCSISIPTNETMAVPILNWMHYYKSANLFDRVFKLSTIFECTILADVKSELAYRLGIRCCKFLGKDVYKTLKIFYDLRSSIVHNGKVDNDTHKKINRLIKKDCEITESIFIFLKEYIEPIVREILCKSVEMFATQKVKNYVELSEKIEKQILNDISQKALCL